MNLAVGDVTLMAESWNPGILPKMLAERFLPDGIGVG